MSAVNRNAWVSFAVWAAGALILASSMRLSEAASSDHLSFSSEQVDHSGRTQIGIASFYAARFAGRTMADGTPMRLHGDNAASLTLPLGTVARVTSLETGRSAIVTIRDRGPYVRGRIVDLSPGTAREIGLSRRTGLTAVAVVPLVEPWDDRQGTPAEALAVRYAPDR